jgi:hypothetical protein
VLIKPHVIKYASRMQAQKDYFYSAFFSLIFLWRQNCISFANFVIKITHISTEFVKDLLLKCAYFT